MDRFAITHALWRTLRFLAAAALAFLLAGVIAPRLVNAHDTGLLILALILYLLAAAALVWGLAALVVGLRRYRRRRDKDWP